MWVVDHGTWLQCEWCEVHLILQYPNSDEKSASSQKSQLELSFEYLMSRDTLQWISIISDQVSVLFDKYWMSLIFFLTYNHILMCWNLKSK